MYLLYFSQLNIAYTFNQQKKIKIMLNDNFLAKINEELTV